jgi:MFS transporter, DHA2 family, multidrug resistance protein
VNALLTSNTQVNHADITTYVTATNRGFETPVIARFCNPMTAAGRKALDAVIARQGKIIAYIDDYKLLLIETGRDPLLAVLGRPDRGAGADHTVVLD